MLNGGRVRNRRRLVGAAGTAVVLVAATLAAPGTAQAAVDATNPVLIAATRTTPATVSGNQAVGVRVQATDSGGSHLTVARIKFRQANGTEFEVSAGYAGQALDVIDDVVTGATGTWLADGTYEAQYVEIDDGDGNSVRYGRDGRIMRGILDVGGHAIAVAALDVVVSNPLSDAAPPQLSAVALRSGSVTAGAPIVMTYTAADVGSGLSQVSALYQSPGAAVPVWVRSPLDGDYGSSGFASGVIPATLPGGGYELSYVVVSDRAGNSTQYTPGSPDTVATTPVGLVPPPAIDLDPLALTVVQPDPPDVTAPHLTALTLFSSDRRLGERATFGFTVTDASPVVEARIFLDDPDGRNTVAVKRCGPFAPGKVSFWFPTDVATGRWDVTGVMVTDAAGNIRLYSPSGDGEQTGQPTHTGPSFDSMHVDLTTGPIRPDPVAVPDSCAEPVVTTSVSPAYAATGSTVAVSGRVSFGGVPVPSPAVAVFAGTGSASRFVALSTGTASGTYAVPVRITGSTTLRAYFLGSGRTNLGEVFGPAVTVRAGAAARVVAGDTSVRVPRGARTTLTAHVVPRRAGVTATLWRRAGGTWKQIATDRSNAKGQVSDRIKRPKRTTSFRWTTLYAGGYLPATSATIVVKR